MRVLLAEDEAVVAFDLEGQIVGLGHEVVSAGSIAEALPLTEDPRLDVAVLDVTLADGPVWPLLQALARRNVPFILLTGHSHDVVPAPWQDAPLLAKPVDPEGLARALARLGREPPPLRRG
jgi:DNA-binding NtrC family response regulator